MRLELDVPSPMRDVMRKTNQIMLLACLVAGCVALPSQPDLITACGLNKADGWVGRAHPPKDPVLQQVRREGFLLPGTTGIHSVWLTANHGTKLAYCEYTGPENCSTGSVATFRRSDGAWVQDENMPIHICMSP
jgi:hypothetical protein